MQKIGKTLIVAYMIIITAMCAVFATLFFVNKPNSTTALARTEAIGMLTKACNDRDITKTSPEGEKFTDPTETGWLSSYFLMHDAGLLTAKCLLESKLEQNVWYNDPTYSGGLYRYWIAGQSVYFETADNGSYEDQDFYPHASLFIITKTGEDSYKTEFLYQVLTTTIDGDGHLSSFELSFEADKEGAYHVHMEGYAYSEQYVVPTEKLSNLNKVSSVGLYDCNLKTDTMIDRISNETNENKLSNSEKLEIVNKLILKSKTHFNGTKKLADFGNIEEQNDANVLKPVNDWMSSKIPQA